jgi:glyoxylase I family protein
MKLEFHHINLCTSDVPGLADFYSEVLDLKPEPSMEALRVLDDQKGYDGGVAFQTDGNIQFHHSQADLGVAFRTGKAINPLERGHLAFRTDDIEAFKKRLDEKGIPYADFGNSFIASWQQVFFYDPAGNIVEVHQANDG